MNYALVTLKPGRERSIVNGNPWVYSGALADVENYEQPGQVCRIQSSDNIIRATGYVNRDAKIACRVLARGESLIDARFIEGRMRRAEALRQTAVPTSTGAYRLINSEGDFLPGLVVDRYGDGVVVQILTRGMELLRDDVIASIETVFAPTFIVERSDTGQRFEEGLEARVGIVRGKVDNPVEINENGLTYRVDLLNGQKTGFYLDQRESRRLIMPFVAGKRVLNLFSYTGGFSVAAAAGGAAHVTSVDSSGPALELARENMALNGFDTLPGEYIKEDVFRFLNDFGEQFDVIVLDPPPFARHKSAVDQAARGYKDINMRAISLLAEDGVMATFSCSHHISPTLFRQILYSAVSDSGRDAQLLYQTGHPADHPFNISHIEGEYLKGLFLRISL